MLFFILFSFLFNFISLITFNNLIKTNKNLYIKIITIYWLFCTLSSSLFIFLNLLQNNNLIYILDCGVWLEFDSLRIKWEFIFDSTNILMILTVVLISTVVHLYSFDYMKEDPHFVRFISYLSLFTFFMLILLSANNFLVMFIGWEGVGLCSYLLINFWFTRIQANKAAIKAILINKIGDLGILFSLLIIYNLYETLDYHTLFLLVSPSFNIDLICFFLFIGCMAKSAQIGLHMWLPDAMEGPTPVSALIHAATMVTAGVFLIIKCSFIFELSYSILIFINIIGLLTSLFGATVGLFQYDIKKIIAYSTCSQLGLMFCACGLSAYSLSLFHLINHAFFKALLFLCAGSIIHSLNDEQDIRKMGGLGFKLKLTYQSLLIGSLSLIGFPFLSGFYSKELILLLTFMDQNNWISFLLVLLTSIITVMYSLKILIQVFFFQFNGLKCKYNNLHEVDILVKIVYIILGSFSIVSGYLLKDLLVGIGSMYLDLYYLPLHYNIHIIEFSPIIIKILVLFIPILGILGYLRFIKFNKNINIYKLYIIYFFNKKYFFDRIINEISLIFLSLSFNYFYYCLDKGFIEKFIVFSLNKLNNISKIIVKFNNFNLFVYLYFIYLFLIIFFYIFLGFIIFKNKCMYFLIFIILYNNLNYIKNRFK